MDILNQIIQAMTKEEVRHFKLFSARTQAEKERKDLQLFDNIRRSGEAYDEEKVFAKLYNGEDKNSFYRLKNRLMSDLNKSLALQHVDDDDVIHTFHLLSLARYFHNCNNYKIALHFIRKAEKKAILIENYELLDFIYTDLIRLSNEFVTINPEDYIRLRKENREQLRVIREIDDILAAVVYRLKISPNISGKVPIFDLLEKTIDDFTQNKSIKQNPKLRFTLYNGVSRLLLSRRDYPTLEEYLLKTYREFTGEGLFNRNNHDTKLQMLVYLCNTLSKNGKSSLSLKYTEDLQNAMEEYNQLHYKKYLIYYYNSLIFNYHVTDKQKGMALLEQLVREKTFKETPFYDFMVYANLAVSYYTNGHFQKAIKAIVQVYLHEGFETASDTFKLRAAVFELILRLETNEFDLVEKRIEKVKKEFKELLSKDTNRVEKEMIKLVDMMNKSIDISSDKNLAKSIRAFIDTHQTEDVDEFSFVNYQIWLKSKVSRA
jgi:hypothetical protein